MTDGTRAVVDFSEWERGLANLAGPIRVQLARSMGVAGGQVIRDVAKIYAPVKQGLLRDAIYLAYRDAYSDDTKITYSISWNAKRAPHGHLIEFGHWQTNAMYQGRDGKWYVGAPLTKPKWVAAHPFLRPALDGSTAMARNAMMARGRERLPELLAEYAR